MALKAHIPDRPYTLAELIPHMTYHGVVNVLENKTSISFCSSKDKLFENIKVAICCVAKLSGCGDCTWLAHVQHRYTEDDKHFKEEMTCDHIIVVDYDPDVDGDFRVLVDYTDRIGYWRVISVAPSIAIQRTYCATIDDAAFLFKSTHIND